MIRKTTLTAGSLTLALLAGTAGAQQASANFNDIDVNGDGFIDYAEAEAVFGPRGADGLMRNDANNDGLISVGELIEGGDAVDGDGNVLDADGTVIDGADSDVAYEDKDRGHGNDPDGFDEDNPGKGHDRDNGERGGGNGGNNGGGKGKNKD